MPRPNRNSRSRLHGRRTPDDDIRIERIVSAPVGPNIRSASVDEVLRAVRTVPPPEDWHGLAPMLVPIFQRLRPYFDGFPEPLRVVVPPGISVSFAIDIGPALLHVSPDIAAGWPVTVDELTARALANVAALAASVPPERVLREPIGGVPSAWLQSGVGGASTFVLAPAQLSRLFGPGPSLFIAPMRDLLIALPAEVDRDFALWLHGEVAAEDPNCLAPVGFGFDGSQIALEALERAVAMA